MDANEVRLHHAAGRAYGRAATCGRKVDHQTEARAQREAVAASQRYDRDLEAYPCCWCGGWHVGRTMTVDERARYANVDWPF